MSKRALQLENTRLRALLADHKAAIADRDAKIARLEEDFAVLKSAIANLLAQRNRGAHLIAKGQGVLFPDAVDAGTPESESSAEDASDDEDSSTEDDEPVPDPSQRGRKKKRRKRELDTSALPREDRVHELPEDQRVCPKTGQPLVPVGEKVFDEVEYQRGQVILIRHRQVVYGLPPDQAEERQAEPITAPMPPRPLENCAAGPMLLAWLLVQQYANHLPLYRQERIFRRDGLRIPRQTLCDWKLQAAEALQPIVEYLLSRIRAGPIMQLDDTPVMCQGGKGSSHFQAYLWTFVNPEVSGVVYRFTAGRGSDLLAAELGDFEGHLVGDGYSGNSAAANKVEGTIVLSGCWAHVTRKFRDARSEAPGTADLLRQDIKRLYAIEREADEAELDPPARLALRQQKSKPVLVDIYSRAQRLGGPDGQFSEAGLMAKAIGYVRNQHRPLRSFLEDGRIPLDNNACERAIRPIAIGRRNWLFAGSLRGGRAAATVYSLIESCRIAEVDPVNYLADVLVRLATHPMSRIDELLPEHWVSTVAAEVAGNVAEPALA